MDEGSQPLPRVGTALVAQPQFQNGQDWAWTLTSIGPKPHRGRKELKGITMELHMCKWSVLFLSQISSKREKGGREYFPSLRQEKDTLTFVLEGTAVLRGNRRWAHFTWGGVSQRVLWAHIHSFSKYLLSTSYSGQWGPRGEKSKVAALRQLTFLGDRTVNKLFIT